MTHFLPRALLLAASAAALTACATAPTPRYPVVEGQAAGTGPTAIEMPKPAYPVRESQAPAAASAPPQGDAEEAPADEPGDIAWAAPQQDSGVIEVATLAPPAASESSGFIQANYVQPQPVLYAQNDEEPPATRKETRTVVSVAGKVVAVDGKPKTYTVKSGQGLDAVARELGTTRKQLADDNKLKEPYLLKPGQVLKGPVSKGKAYVVESGDTLTAVAKRFNVKPAALAEENNISVKAAIKKGQKLRLPQGFKDSGPVKKSVTVDVPAPAAPRPRPPVQQPPADLPDDPRAGPARPPVEAPYDPRALPPAQTPPVQQPPVQTAPTQLPPARPPVEKPVSKPPVSKPPVAKPPVATPPVVTPPPVTKPPVYKPPVTQPSAPPAQTKPLPPLMPDDKPPAYTDSDYTRMAAGRFQWPVRGTIISTFGPKATSRQNDGVDIAAAAGTPVVAAADGIVKLANELPNTGLTVIILHADGWATVYANLRSADVSMDQRVSRGQKIGVVGQSGGAPRPQLHFEVRHSPSAKYKARAIDPQLVLPR